MMKSIIFLLLFFIPIITFSQVSNDMDESNIFSILHEESDTSGIVFIYQDSRIENLVIQHIEKNKNTKGIWGYRINIFFESGIRARENAFTVRDTFNKYNSEVPSYTEYQTPNYKVYVGDFRTKADAEIFLREIKQKYPKAFTVPMRINYPKID